MKKQFTYQIKEVGIPLKINEHSLIVVGGVILSGSINIDEKLVDKNDNIYNCVGVLMAKNEEDLSSEILVTLCLEGEGEILIQNDILKLKQ